MMEYQLKDVLELGLEPCAVIHLTPMLKISFSNIASSIDCEQRIDDSNPTWYCPIINDCHSLPPNQKCGEQQINRHELLLISQIVCNGNHGEWICEYSNNLDGGNDDRKLRFC